MVAAAAVVVEALPWLPSARSLRCSRKDLRSFMSSGSSWLSGATEAAVAVATGSGFMQVRFEFVD